MRLSPDYPELLADVAMHIHAELVKAGIEPAVAEKIARDAAERVRVDWGGQIIYVPIGKGFETAERWQEIYKEFNGKNHAQLAKKHQLTEIHIYRIVKSMMEKEQRERQALLFPAEAK